MLILIFFCKSSYRLYRWLLLFLRFKLQALVTDDLNRQRIRAATYKAKPQISCPNGAQRFCPPEPSSAFSAAGILQKDSAEIHKDSCNRKSWLFAFSSCSWGRSLPAKVHHWRFRCSYNNTKSPCSAWPTTTGRTSPTNLIDVNSKPGSQVSLKLWISVHQNSH